MSSLCRLSNARIPAWLRDGSPRRIVGNSSDCRSEVTAGAVQINLIDPRIIDAVGLTTDLDATGRRWREKRGERRRPGSKRNGPALQGSTIETRPRTGAPSVVVNITCHGIRVRRHLPIAIAEAVGLTLFCGNALRCSAKLECVISQVDGTRSRTGFIIVVTLIIDDRRRTCPGRTISECPTGKRSVEPGIVE